MTQFGFPFIDPIPRTEIKHFPLTGSCSWMPVQGLISTTRWPSLPSFQSLQWCHAQTKNFCLSPTWVPPDATKSRKKQKKKNKLIYLNYTVKQMLIQKIDVYKWLSCVMCVRAWFTAYPSPSPCCHFASLGALLHWTGSTSGLLVRASERTHLTPRTIRRSNTFLMCSIKKKIKKLSLSSPSPSAGMWEMYPSQSELSAKATGSHPDPMISLALVLTSHKDSDNDFIFLWVLPRPCDLMLTLELLLSWYPYFCFDSQTKCKM